MGHAVVSILGCPLWLKSWIPPQERSKLEPLGRISGLVFTHPPPGEVGLEPYRVVTTLTGPILEAGHLIGDRGDPGVHDGQLGPVLVELVACY